MSADPRLAALAFPGTDPTALRMRELAVGDPDPWSRDRFAPGHFTASGFVLSPDGGSLLLIAHRRLRRWLQPGGHIDPADADPESAARREIAEETGVADLVLLSPGPVDLDIHEIPARGTEPAHLHFDLRYAYRARSDRVVADPEVADARWVALDDLPDRGVDPGILRAVRKLTELVGR